MKKFVSVKYKCKRKRIAKMRTSSGVSQPAFKGGEKLLQPVGKQVLLIERKFIENLLMNLDISIFELSRRDETFLR